MSSNQIIVLVCVLYFVVMIGTGIFAAKRNKKTSDFLVAGRKTECRDDGHHAGRRPDRRRHRPQRGDKRI